MSKSSRTESSNGASESSKSHLGRRIMALVLAVLILLLGLLTYLLYGLLVVPGGAKSRPAAEASADGLTWVRSIYGTSDQVKDLFGQTVAAVPGTDGSIWITEANTRGLVHFSSDGRYLQTLESVDTSAPLQSPSRIAVGPDGLLYVCETALDMVRVLRPDGTEEGSFTVPQPVSVAVSEDRIAVGSVYGFAILEKTGQPIKVFGSRGKGDDQFDYVHGIAFDGDGNVYVTDSYNNRLSAYDRHGNRLWLVNAGSPANTASFEGGMLTPSETTGTVLSGDSALQLPLGLAVDGSGRVVVSDMYECALAVFDAKTGKFIGKYGEPGADDGQFFYPVSVAYDAGHDWFTVADAFNKRVQIVRIPNSSRGIGVVATINRSLAGPLRACVFPLLLILLAFVVWFVVRFVRRRAEEGAKETRVSSRGSGSSIEGRESTDDLFSEVD